MSTMKTFYDLSYPTLTMYIHCKSAADYARVIEKTESNGYDYATPWDELTNDWWHPNGSEEKKHFTYVHMAAHKSNSDIIYTITFHDVHNAHEMMSKLEKYFFDYTDGYVTMLKYSKLDLNKE